MPDQIEIIPTGPLNTSIRPPGSKSITNRALICAGLAAGKSRLTGALDSEDTGVMVAALQTLGLDVTHDQSNSIIHVTGCGGVLPNDRADLNIENSGTTIRFLTAMLAACRGQFRIDGIARMRERPIGDLLAALEQLGGAAKSELSNGCPPVVIEANGLRGGTAKIRGNISSQFLSGLLMAVPYSEEAVVIDVEGELVSKPYVTMTLGVMSAFGVAVEAGKLERFIIPKARYEGCSYDIEPDASAASYFWGAAAVTGGLVRVEGLHRNALQGDVAFCECLAQMGCKVIYGDNHITVEGNTLRGITVDMNAISDTAQTLAVVALFADGPTTITGVAHIRHKETDRVGDLARELRKLGAVVEEFDDGLTITPQSLRPATLDTYNDHRMAMSFAVAGLRSPGIVINDPSCTRKTYPNFFEDLRRISS
ncbi:MAG: 3-phosphoshikimate 1-carboxyvinyltransferase [Planctomycetaceae bacterium]|nr:3-phosphoshikimate 1-carboxyvinyltransferase [Planctomycetales bacterium]MCB9873672.1 3-phosphoshikimate 1-carboxyvinyltransferase [Planctomycetaceae bacterium]